MSRHLERLLKIDNLLRSSNLQTSDTLANALVNSQKVLVGEQLRNSQVVKAA